MAQYLRDRYFRAPNWRFARATELFNDGVARGSRSEDDAPTLANLRLLRKLAGQSKCKWTPKLKALQAAHVLKENRAHDIVCLELECRILAGVANVEISQATTIPIEIVEAYEETFFDIRDRLDSQNYIHSIVLDTRPMQLKSDPDQLLRYFAYTCGLTGFEPLMLVYRASESTLASGFTPDLASRIQRCTELERLFRQGRQGVCSPIASLLSILGVDPDALFGIERVAEPPAGDSEVEGHRGNRSYAGRCFGVQGRVVKRAAGVLLKLEA